eukprot:CCRYP_011242-RA/>CCRYP_011242-RA protein AED:0.04 eAED:0.04 QI:3166/1/1/1/0.87/0.66/9/3311/169
MSSWKPECIGGVSMMESAPEVTPRPSPANKGGPPSFSPTTKWDAWVGSKYANSDSSASLNETTTVAAAGSNSTEAEGDLMNGTVTAEPTQSPMADPFSWVSSGTFNGEGYSSSSMNSDSPWWDDRGSSGARTMSPCVTIVPCVIIVYAVMFLYDCRKTSREVGSILSFK